MLFRSTNFFSTNTYLIDEKINFLQFQNEYKIFNEEGTQIGAVAQKISAGQKALRMLLSKSMLPFTLNIMNSDGGIEATIKRGFTFFTSKIQVLDSAGNPIAQIQQKFRLLKPKFLITDMENRLIGEVKGDWKAWSFSITDSEGREIGKISKKWAGTAKEIFTTADKYMVSIDPAFANSDSKKALIPCAITIDMVLKES